MINTIQEPRTFGFATYLPAVRQSHASASREVYEQNRHRVYAIAFWMTDHELAAEAVMTDAFSRAFASYEQPNSEQVDNALITELRARMPLGALTLDCEPSEEVRSVRYNILRVDLERAVVQLPGTEKLIFIMHDVEGYDHARIADTLQLTEDQTRLGLHQARLCVRQFLASQSKFAC
jgi:RNA polymerase sigma-70 factor (ECF subfamily)